MTETSKVVDLRKWARYQPDFAAIARQRLIAARRALDLSAAEFAAVLTPLVGWPITGEAIEAWENDSVPPGDALVAVETLGQAGSGLASAPLIGSVLGKIPQSFSAEELCGSWVTCFQFGPETDPKRHVDIAQISLASDQVMRITNHPLAARSEGRASPFRNDIEAQLANRHLIGHWKNSNDTRYFGSLHLAVLPGETVMEGRYTGFASDIEVSFGPWKWVRLDPDTLVEADLTEVRLQDPIGLYDLVMSHSKTDAPLPLSAIREDA